MKKKYWSLVCVLLFLIGLWGGVKLADRKQEMGQESFKSFVSMYTSTNGEVDQAMEKYRMFMEDGKEREAYEAADLAFASATEAVSLWWDEQVPPELSDEAKEKLEKSLTSIRKLFQAKRSEMETAMNVIEHPDDEKLKAIEITYKNDADKTEKKIRASFVKTGKMLKLSEEEVHKFIE